MQRATDQDIADIRSFLGANVTHAMFPLSNLIHYGTNGGDDRAMTFWLTRKNGTVTDVLGLTDRGVILPCCPTASAGDMVAALAGQNIHGVNGPAAQARPLVQALGLTGAQLDRDEPHYALNLADLIVPTGPGDLHPITDTHRFTIRGWIVAYDMEALGSHLRDAENHVDGTLDRYMASQSHRVLMKGDTPLAMTGFNATTEDCVQVGGVYTPFELRGQGHARRAVALHLAQARDNGATKSVLFAANTAACTAYESIGYRRIGAWTLYLGSKTITVPATAS